MYRGGKEESEGEEDTRGKLEVIGMRAKWVKHGWWTVKV